MNVYDCANQLKKSLTESREVKNYTNSLAKVKGDPGSKRMLDDFRKKQIELQAKQFSGIEPDKDELDQLQRLYSVVNMNPDINRFLQHEYELSTLMNDIYKIISEAVDIDLGFEDEK